MVRFLLQHGYSSAVTPSTKSLEASGGSVGYAAKSMPSCKKLYHVGRGQLSLGLSHAEAE